MLLQILVLWENVVSGLEPESRKSQDLEELITVMP
jgi:hypothetical protein